MNTNDLTNKVHELRELSAMLEEINAEIKALQHEIKDHMQRINVDTLSGTDYKITYKPVQSSRIDTAALKRTLPDIAQQFMKQTSYMRFDLR